VASSYAIRRARSFVVVVECTEPAASCFCVSAGAGPRVGDGAADEELRYDLKPTETVGRRGGVRYVARTGSCLGAEIFRAVAHVPVNHHTAQTAHAAVSEAATRMRHSGRALPTVDISALLAATAEARTWDMVSALCTACGDCAAVCPAGGEPDSWSTPEDYRRWLTGLFDAAACVGCGRCVLACPVGIDPVTLLGALQQDWELEAQDE
jgi:sulfhydrogenase subunit beta (sulfur reductase)